MEQSIAWAAGLFEGEGCFNAYQRTSGKWQVQARVRMTDRDVVERFAAVVGVGSVRGPIAPARDNWTPTWEWYLYTAVDITALIDSFLPWLGERRRAKALEVRAVAQTIRPHYALRTHCPSGHPYEGENLVIEAAGYRRCRTCRNNGSRERARAKRALSIAA